MGKLKGFQANISLSSDASPRFHKPRPVPFALQARVDEEIDRLVKEDVLRPVEQSAWAAPVVVVRKGDGSIRLCGDYKVTINPFLENNQYATPNAQDLFATLAGGRKFTRLDLKQANLQMEVEPESQPYLTINTRKGLFTFNRMPFGIRTAPSIWQKAMDMILTGIPGVCCFLDDILVVGSTDEEHDERLKQVLERLSQSLRKDKCVFGKREVQYLGHVVDHQGLRPTTEKVKAISEAPEPSNLTELKSFLGY